jgi:hypothetical protein
MWSVILILTAIQRGFELGSRGITLVGAVARYMLAKTGKYFAYVTVSYKV